MTAPANIYTLAEAAERLRLTKNALARLARRTGHCSSAGRLLLFSEEDLAAIWQAMRVQGAAQKFDPGPSLALDSIDIERRARELLERPRRKQSASGQ